MRIHSPLLRARLLLLRAKVSLASGRSGLRAARQALRAAGEIEGAPAAVHFYWGEAWVSDNPTEAREAYERYLSASPEGPLAARARQALEGL